MKKRERKISTFEITEVGTGAKTRVTALALEERLESSDGSKAC